MAGKMEEIYPIDVKEWSHLAAETFTPRQLLRMERLISKVLRSVFSYRRGKTKTDNRKTM